MKDEPESVKEETDAEDESESVKADPEPVMHASDGYSGATGDIASYGDEYYTNDSDTDA